MREKKTNYTSFSKDEVTEEIVEAPVEEEKEVVKEEKPVVKPSKKVKMAKVIASSGLNVRKEPAADAVVIKVAPEGAEFEVVSNYDNDDWTKIKVGGQEAYVMSRFVKID